MYRASQRLRVLTWHVHGNYLWYLTHAPHDFYVPVKPGRPHPYGGRTGTFPWPDNLYEVAADDVRRGEKERLAGHHLFRRSDIRHDLLSRWPSLDVATRRRTMGGDAVQTHHE